MSLLKSAPRYFKDLWLRGFSEAGTPVIIYQMGKVGSASLMRSLNQYGIRPAYQVHRMHPDRVDAFMRKREQRNPNDNNILMIDRQGLKLYETIVQPRRRAKFITIARNPVDRNISAFFFNFYRLEERFKGLSIDKIVRSFLLEYPHDVPLKWFQENLKKTLGINVFDTPFPHDVGYVRLESGPFDLLVLRTETPDSVKEEAIRQFLGMAEFSVTRHNAGSDRAYADTYRSFKQKAKLPDSYLDRLLESQYAQHFYTKEEIDATYRRWS